MLRANLYYMKVVDRVTVRKIYAYFGQNRMSRAIFPIAKAGLDP